MFTFGICCTKENTKFHQIILNSILQQKINNVQVIFIGEELEIKPEECVDFVYFNEKLKTNWITKKKNLITKFSKNENIVFMHDYIKLNENWFEGFLKFGNDFDLCMNKIINLDGERWFDWHLNHEIVKLPNRELLLPYDVHNLSKLMYFNGSYYICKKKICEEFPLNEKLIWGQGEDIEFSNRVLTKYNFKMNAFSSVQCLKQKEKVFSLISEKNLNLIQLKFKAHYD
jgi:hypothetical protein